MKMKWVFLFFFSGPSWVFSQEAAHKIDLASLVSHCDPEDDHHIVLHPEEEETSGTVYQWQSFVGLEWVDYQASWSLELDPAVVEDRLYRLKITPATGPSSFSSPFHTYGHGSGNSYAGSLPSDGYPVYFIQGNGDITGNLTVDGTLLRMKGMSSYNSEAPGGTVEGTFLTVKPGATLTIQNHSTVESACQNMWGGFILEVPSTGSAHAGISVDASSEIRDAWTGIGATEITSTVNRPSIDVQGAHFTNCYMGIKIGAPASGSYLKNNTFVSAYDEMKAPFDWERNQAFRPAKGDDEDNKSAPDPTGLVAKYVSLLGIMFTEPFSFSSNGHFTGNSFNNMAFGVFCDFSNSTFNSAIHPVVSGNTFEKCHLASVLARGCGNIEVSGCTLTVNSTQDGLFTHLMDGAGAAWVGNDHVNPPLIPILNTYGIHLAGCTSAVERKVTGNVLVSSNQNLPYLFHHGTKVGAEATNELTYTGNQVTGFHFGLALHQESGGGNVAVRGNTFTDNRFGVYLEEGTMDMDFGCNQFRLSCMDEYPDNGPAVNNSSHPCYNEFTSGPDRVGLFVGENAVIDGSIGGPGGISSPILPAGNVWPVGNRSQDEIELSSYELTGWVHPPSFTAVVNESEEGWNYYHFENEFFNHLDNSISGNALFPSSQRFGRTSTDQEIPPALAGQVDLVCEDVFTSIVFPLLPRPTTGKDLTAKANLMQVGEAILDQNIPNPATHTTTISFYLPASTQRGRLEVFELETGRLLKGFDIWQPGNGAIEFETRSLPSGIFGYRLIVDGQPAAHKKMVITH